MRVYRLFARVGQEGGVDLFAAHLGGQKAAEDWPHSKTLARYPSRHERPPGFGDSNSSSILTRSNRLQCAPAHTWLRGPRRCPRQSPHRAPNRRPPGGRFSSGGSSLFRLGRLVIMLITHRHARLRSRRRFPASRRRQFPCRECRRKGGGNKP